MTVASTPAYATQLESTLVDFSPWLYRLTWRRLGDHEAAADATQETLRRALTALRCGKVEKTVSLRGFLLSTARHVCCHYIRSRQRERRAMARLDTPAVDLSAGSALRRLVTKERLAALRAEVRRLSAADREFLRQLYVDELLSGRLARATGSSPSSLRVRKHRLLRHLRRRLSSM